MNTICLMEGMLLIGIGVIWLLSWICLLMRIKTNFFRYSGCINLLDGHIKYVLHKKWIRARSDLLLNISLAGGRSLKRINH